MIVQDSYTFEHEMFGTVVADLAAGWQADVVRVIPADEREALLRGALDAAAATNGYDLDRLNYGHSWALFRVAGEDDGACPECEGHGTVRRGPEFHRCPEGC